MFQQNWKILISNAEMKLPNNYYHFNLYATNSFIIIIEFLRLILTARISDSVWIKMKRIDIVDVT